MPEQTIALISTGLDLAVKIKDKVRTLIPRCRVISIVDDSVLSMIGEGSVFLPLDVTRRICDYVVHAEQSSADVILITCSSISETVDVARNLVRVPVLKIDEPMIEEAVKKGGKIGVAATLPTTLKPTVRLLKHKANELGRTVEIKTLLVQDAFKILYDGHKEKHDSLVREAISQFQETTDCIILAQASMAGAIENFESKVPILTSFPSGLKAACDLLISPTSE